jgi:hypothetical protein
MCKPAFNRSFFILAKKLIIFTNSLFIILLVSRSDCFSQEFSGHWKSSEDLTTTAAAPAYLNLDICDNGDFSGIFGAYTCVLMGTISPFYYCVRDENASTDQASGYIDFNQDNGTITIGDCIDIPFTILEKSSENLTFQIHTADTCGDLSFDIKSKLNYEGDAGEYCNTGEGNTSNNNGDSGGGGNGSGGCFLNAISVIKDYK